MSAKIKTNQSIGILLLTGAAALFVPYTLLTLNFEYPDILRQDTGLILSKFHAGGPGLIMTWLAFALVGLPLIPAYVLIGQKLETNAPHMRWATSIGVTGLVVQMIGLLRWVFVIPVLARHYLNGNEAAKEAAIVGFKVVHQFGGVLLGEHLGQLFTVVWTLALCVAFHRQKTAPNSIVWLGYVASGVYFLAQTELIATVIPEFPTWNLAGFLGSTLWLIWLIVLGVRFLRIKQF